MVGKDGRDAVKSFNETGRTEDEAHRKREKQSQSITERFSHNGNKACSNPGWLRHNSTFRYGISTLDGQSAMASELETSDFDVANHFIIEPEVTEHPDISVRVPRNGNGQRRIRGRERSKGSSVDARLSEAAKLLVDSDENSKQCPNNKADPPPASHPEATLTSGSEENRVGLDGFQQDMERALDLGPLPSRASIALQLLNPNGRIMGPVDGQLSESPSHPSGDSPSGEQSDKADVVHVEGQQVRKKATVLRRL